jgi:hypothetical protein
VPPYGGGNHCCTHALLGSLLVRKPSRLSKLWAHVQTHCTAPAAVRWQDVLAARAKGATRLKPLLLDQVRPCAAVQGLLGREMPMPFLIAHA